MPRKKKSSKPDIKTPNEIQSGTVSKPREVEIKIRISKKVGIVLVILILLLLAKMLKRPSIYKTQAECESATHSVCIYYTCDVPLGPRYEK